MADPNLMDPDGDPMADAMTGEGADDFDVLEQEDGSALVSLPEDDEAYESTDFGENMAEFLPDDVLAEIGSDLVELVNSDKESRKERDKQYAEGIKRTGLGDEAPGGADFDGASRAVHPMLVKGCVDFASRAIKELFPANGPCKTQIIGEPTDIKVDKAERKKEYMNWQLTTRVAENRAELERLLSQLPLGGSQYKRWWWDNNLERPRTETVYVDDVFLPYSQSDFYTSYRVTHRQWVSKDEFASRVSSGLYIDIDSGLSDDERDYSESKKATDKVEGNEEDSTAYNEEGQREVYMSYVDLLIDEDDYADGRTAPYIVHIETDTQKVLGLYRNWEEGDDSYAKQHWMVEYCFISWRGAYGVGLYHLIGSLAASGTGALRALLDSAHISNFPGGLKLKGGRTAGQTIQVNATELAEIDAPPGVDDIRKLVMPFPFNGPSPVLFNMLEWLTQQAETVIATASEALNNVGNDTPVGTTLALIEHGSTNFSAIHARCHASLKRELEILHRLDRQNITDEEVIEELGEMVVTREDFQGPMDIIPVSDPNIFSEAQRYAQLQAVMQLAATPTLTPLFKQDRLLSRALRLLQIPNADELANLPKDPKRRGAIDENYLIASPEPGPIKVYREQDDVAHLETHLHFVTSPILGSNQLIAPAVIVPMMTHVKDHLMNLYFKHASAAADAMEMTAQAMGQPMTRAQAEAKGAAFCDQTMAKLLGEMIMPAIGQAQKLAQQFGPKPPVDPQVQAQLAAQASQAQMAAQTQMQLEDKRSQLEQNKAQFAAAEAEKERQHKLQLKTKELLAKAAENQLQLDANDRATVMATTIEKHTLDVTTQLTQFSEDAKAQAQERAAQAEADKQARKAEYDAQLMVLSETLKNQAAQIANAQQPPVDVVGLVTPLVEAMQSNTAEMMQQLHQGLSALHQTHAAPRVARYIKDEAGNNIGVESVIKG